MKKLILYLIIAFLFVLGFFPTIGKLTNANTQINIVHTLSNITTDSFTVVDNNVNINIIGMEIDEDPITILPITNIYNNTLSFMINGTLEGIADAYNRLQDAASMPTGSVYYASFSPDSTKLAIGFNQAPLIRIYDITTDPMTSFTTLDSYVSQPMRAITYNNTGDRLAIGLGASVAGSPYLTVYRTDITPYTRLTDPETPTGLVLSMEYSPDDTHLAVGHANAPYLTIYDTSTTPYTKLSSPSTMPTGTVSKIKYSHDGNYLVVGFIASPYLLVYDTTTTPYTNIGSILDPSYTVTPLGIVFSKDDSLLIVGGQSILSIYDTGTIPFTRINTIAIDTGVMDLNHNDTILTAKFGSGVRIYDMNNLFNILTLMDVTYTTAPSYIQYSPDGSRLVVTYASATPSFSLYNTNVKYFNILDQNNNVLHSIDFETNYVDQIINLNITNLEAIHFKSSGIDPLVTSTLSIDVTLLDTLIENDSVFTPLIRFMPLVAFIVIVTIAVAYVSHHKN